MCMVVVYLRFYYLPQLINFVLPVDVSLFLLMPEHISILPYLGLILTASIAKIKIVELNNTSLFKAALSAPLF